MPYIPSWDEFVRAAEEIYQANPYKVSYNVCELLIAFVLLYVSSVHMIDIVPFCAGSLRSEISTLSKQTRTKSN